MTTVNDDLPGEQSKVLPPLDIEVAPSLLSTLMADFDSPQGSNQHDLCPTNVRIPFEALNWQCMDATSQFGVGFPQTTPAVEGGHPYARSIKSILDDFSAFTTPVVLEE